MASDWLAAVPPHNEKPCLTIFDNHRVFLTWPFHCNNGPRSGDVDVYQGTRSTLVYVMVSYHSKCHYNPPASVGHFEWCRMISGNPFQIISSHYSDVIMSAMVSQITGVSSVYSTVCSGADQRKHQGSASFAFVRGIHPSPVTRGECFHLMTSSWESCECVTLGQISWWFILHDYLIMCGNM